MTRDHRPLLLVLCAVPTLLLSACGPKQTGVRFTDEELASERPQVQESRVKPPAAVLAPPEPRPAPVRERLTCTTYCTHTDRNCRGQEAVYGDKDDCIAACRKAPWAPGKKGAVGGNTLACRLTWAKAAAQDPRRCADAGPLSPACLQVQAVDVPPVPPVSGASLCVMGLYDSTDQPSWNAGGRSRDVILRGRVTPIISRLGWVLRTHDVSLGLPTDGQMQNCRAIVTAFYDGKVGNASKYVSWLGRHAKAGRRVVILNNFGAYQDAESGQWTEHERINSVLSVIGVRYDGQWSGDGEKLSLRRRDKTIFHEIPNPKEAAHYFRFRPTRADTEVHLEVVRSDINDGASAVVFTSPAGGMALTRYYETRDGAEQLDLDLFLRRALSTNEGTP